MNIKKISQISMLLALSVVLSIIESMLPINGSIPGLKLGLANTVIVFVIYKYSLKDAFSISILRVFLVGLLRTGLFNIAFFFSIGGALLSVLMMYIAYNTNKFSVIGVSIVGAISHNIGQILVGIFILKGMGIMYYLPFLLFFSIPTGIIVGASVNKVLNYYNNL